MAVIIDNTVLVLTRLALFFGCRKLLLQSLYSDLRHLSSTSTIAGPQTPTEEYIRLDPLPTPVQTDTTKHRQRERTLHSTLSRTLFALCFSECCMLFLLLMAQGIGVFEASTRLTNWKLSISFLLIAVLILTPLFVSLVISLGTGSTRLFINFLPLFGYLYLLSLIPVPSGLTNNDLFTVTLARLVVVGTIILGLLSGVGAVAALEEYFGVFIRGRSEPTMREIESAERALMKVREDLRARTEEVSRRASDSPTSSSWMSRVVPKFTGGDDLTLELKGLQALESEMSLNLEDLRSRYARAEFASTFRGRILIVCGKVFAGYCVIRIIS
ncbi:hypothetical protein V5O48_016538, partial [Marasmius crinis-equi]